MRYSKEEVEFSRGSRRSTVVVLCDTGLGLRGSVNLTSLLNGRPYLQFELALRW